MPDTPLPFVQIATVTTLYGYCSQNRHRSQASVPTIEFLHEYYSY